MRKKIGCGRLTPPGKDKVMNTCKVVKDGKKWSVILEDGSVAYTGKTRVRCFRFAKENNLKVTQIQHGGK